jgi:uncharacterized protein with GYD domain
MPTYVGLYTWTDQGIRNVKDTVKRVEEARAAFEKGGARVIAIYCTQGLALGAVTADGSRFTNLA